jgi:ubiquinol-cytochrome c reductase core subunit 2
MKEMTVKNSRLPNGMTVCSLECGGALSRLAMAFRAGSRYEEDHSLGASHVLRNMVGNATATHGGFETQWRAAILGSEIHATHTRDLLMVQFSAFRDHAAPALEVLGEMASQPEFRAHELADDAEFLAVQRALHKQDPVARLHCLLHRAAYRNGPLGNPLLAPGGSNYRGKVHVLQKFAAEHLVSGDAALVGVNIDHELLLAYATQHAQVNEGKPALHAGSPYLGGQERKHKGSAQLSYVALTGQCAGLNDAKGVAAAAVFGSVVGSGPNVKWSSQSGSTHLATAAAKAVGDAPLGVSNVLVLHPEQGLAGVFAVTAADKMGALLKSVQANMKQLAQSGPSAKELAAAKQKTITHSLMRSEDRGLLLEDLTSQALASGLVTTPLEMLEHINAVTIEQVKQVAASVVAKPSMAALGNLSHTPYLDEL